MFFLLVCLVLKFTDWYTRKFYDKMIIIGCCENEPYLLILKEQIDYFGSIDIIKGLEAFIPQKRHKVEVLTVYQTYLENDKCEFDETNDISKLIYAAVNGKLELTLLKGRQRFDTVSTSNLKVYKFRER